MQADDPAPNRSKPRARDRSSLLTLLGIMRCPQTKEPLELSDDGLFAVSAVSRVQWAIEAFVPQMFRGLAAKVYSDDHFSNGLAADVRAIINGTDGLVLNLSAGGSEEWFPNVVETEAGRFRNTDIVGDAHNLPFADGVFSACVAMNAFEHYRSPDVVASEIFRVLKPGGEVMIHTAFLQPVHEAPYHFYNATPFGVAKWFESFVDGAIATPWNFNPVFALSWIAADLDAGLRAEGASAAADLIGSQTLLDLMAYWRHPERRNGPAWDAFYAASAELRGRLAAGVEYRGRKPL